MPQSTGPSRSPLPTPRSIAYTGCMPAGIRQIPVGRITLIALAVALGLGAIDAISLAWMAPAYGRLVLFGSLVLALAALGAALLRRAGFRLPALLVMVASFALNAWYLSGTAFDERNYDAPAHLQYIHRLVELHQLPMAKDCSICHHPPLYHLLAAGVMVAAYRSAVVSAPFALQVMSLGLFYVFVAFGVLTVQALMSDTRVQPWAAAFLVFWPVSVINSVRLNNDLLLFALVSAGMYYLVRWRRDRARRHLIVACALAVGATFTKLNGLILAGALGGLLAWDAARKGEPRQRARRDWAVIAAMVLALGVMGGVRLWREPGPLSHRALGAAALDRPTSPHGLARTYLTFDVVAYLRTPYSIAGMTGDNDVPYWNHLLKSSLFGTRNLLQWADGKTFRSNVTLVRVESALLLLLIGYVLVALAVVRRVPRDHRVLSVYLALWFIVAGLSFHIWAPRPHHTDFRFIYPILIPAAAVFFESAKALRRRRAFAGAAGYVLVGAFWIGAIWFFAFGVRPDAAELAERVLPGPKSEEPRPNTMLHLEWTKPRPTRMIR